MTSYQVVSLDTLGNEHLIDTFLSLTDALTYADMLNRQSDRTICFVRHN